MPPILGTGPKNAIVFASHGAILRHLEGERIKSADGVGLQQKRSASLTNIFLAGNLSGALQCLAIVPADRIKCQLQVQTAHHSPGVVACVRQLVSRHGVWYGIFGGTSVTLLRTVHSCGWYFTSFEVAKRELGGETQLHPVAATLIAGGIAGSVGAVSSYPLDVLKSYIQSLPLPQDPRRDGTIRAAATVLYKHHGWGWLSRGLAATLARAALINAVNFCVYDTVRGAVH